MSAQGEVDRMAKQGYWLGGVHASANLCTCKGITHDEFGEVHNKFCPKYKPEWVRRGSAKDLTVR